MNLRRLRVRFRNSGNRRLGGPLPGEKGEQKDEVPRRPRSQVGRRAVAERRRQRGRIPSREADGKEWPPGGMAGRPAATITGPAVERDATRRTPASAENETGELMSSGGAKDAFVLIPAPWEQPEKGERAGARAGQLGPHSGARPAGQPPAGASRQACGCPSQPARPRVHFVPGCLWPEAGKGGVLLWLGPRSKC